MKTRNYVGLGARKRANRQAARYVANVFCPTGEGGGVDPSCKMGPRITTRLSPLIQTELASIHSSLIKDFPILENRTLFKGYSDKPSGASPFEHDGGEVRVSQLLYGKAKTIEELDKQVDADAGSAVRAGFRGAVIHEIGHTLDMLIVGNLNDEGREIWWNEKKELQAQLGSPSEYGNKSMSEWVAERFLAERLQMVPATLSGVMKRRLSHLTTNSFGPIWMTANTRSKNPLKSDPTRTATLRRSFETEMVRRFVKFRRELVSLIVDEDAFGLKEANKPWNPVINTFCPTGPGGGVDPSCSTGRANPHYEKTFIGESEVILPRGQFYSLTGTTKEVDDAGFVTYRVKLLHQAGITANTRWSFRTSPEKIKEFLKWLEGNLRPILTDETTTDDDWWNKYVQAGFKKGTARSYDDMKKAGAIPQSNLPFYFGQKDEFLRSAFRQPESVEKVKMLAGRVYTELRGVTEAMSQNLTRTLTDGLTQGMNPRQIATNIVKVVEDIGIKRARVIARTEIIRAHAEGQLDSMERLGVKRLAVMVEWNTAQDDRVCKLCAPLDGIVVTIDEAKGLIPRHPNCRCAFIPANVGEDETEQIRGASRIKKAITKSLVAGKSKRKSTWAGARRKIGKSRPKSLVGNSRFSVRNVFCRTGEGGGVDPSCSSKQKPIKIVDEDAGTMKAYYKALGESVPADDPLYVYHSTHAQRLSAIASDGLQPGKKSNFEGFSTTESVSLSPTVADAIYWSSASMWRQYDDRKDGTVDKPVILRTLKHETMKEYRRDELRVPNVSPDKLEIWESGKWTPLKQ